MRNHKVTSRGRAQRSATRAGRSQSKELPEIGRCSTQNTVPDNRAPTYLQELFTLTSQLMTRLTLRLPSFFCNTGYQGGGWLPPPLDFVFGFTYHNL